MEHRCITLRVVSMVSLLALQSSLLARDAADVRTGISPQLQPIHSRSNSPPVPIPVVCNISIACAILDVMHQIDCIRKDMPHRPSADT